MIRKQKWPKINCGIVYLTLMSFIKCHRSMNDREETESEKKKTTTITTR